MRIYLKNNPAKFHPIRWNDGALFWRASAQQQEEKNKNKLSSDVGSASDPKLVTDILFR